MVLITAPIPPMKLALAVCLNFDLQSMTLYKLKLRIQIIAVDNPSVSF